MICVKLWMKTCTEPSFVTKHLTNVYANCSVYDRISEYAYFFNELLINQTILRSAEGYVSSGFIGAAEVRSDCIHAFFSVQLHNNWISAHHETAFSAHFQNKCPAAGLGSSIGCAVRLETRRSRVQPPPRSATFFRGDWSWNIFYGHSLPSADSRRAVVSFWRKKVHNTG